MQFRFIGELSHVTGEGTAAKNEPEKVDSGEKWLVKRSPKPGRGKNKTRDPRVEPEHSVESV